MLCSRLLVISLLSLAQTRWMTGTRRIIWKRPLAAASVIPGSSLKPLASLAPGKGHFSVFRYMAGKSKSTAPRYTMGKEPQYVTGYMAGDIPPHVSRYVAGNIPPHVSKYITGSRQPSGARYLSRDGPRDMSEARTTQRNMNTVEDKLLEDVRDIISDHEAEAQDRNKEEEIGSMMQSKMTKLKPALPLSDSEENMLVRLLKRGHTTKSTDGRIRIL